MNIPKSETIDLGEYEIQIEYDGKGGLEITVFDELGGPIEGIYISDVDDMPEDLGFDINMN